MIKCYLKFSEMSSVAAIDIHRNTFTLSPPQPRQFTFNYANNYPFKKTNVHIRSTTLILPRSFLLKYFYEANGQNHQNFCYLVDFNFTNVKMRLKHYTI